MGAAESIVGPVGISFFIPIFVMCLDIVPVDGEQVDPFVGSFEEIELKPTGEEDILLIRALCGLDRIISNVNIPNTCMQIPNLPAAAVAETNAVFSRDSIKPLMAGSVPEPVKTLLMPHIENHERVLNAALSCDRELVYTAFSNDPLVKGRASENEIRKLADDMIANTFDWLPKNWNM